MHGEYRHLVPTPGWPRQMGVRPTTCSSARTVTRSCSTTTASAGAGCPAGYLYVDGIVGDVGHGVLRDRRVLAEEGVVVVVVAVDVQTGRSSPGRRSSPAGWVYAPEAEDLLDEAPPRWWPARRSARDGDARDIEALQREVRRAPALRQRAHPRRPMIVPVVMEA